jgi:adenylate cyclase
VSPLAVALESILPALQGTIPSPFATCSRDGTPNITFLSIVHYVDRERVALSRQFFNKSRANLDANPQSQVWVIDPRDFRQYALDLTYLHTETDGPIFQQMRTNLEAIAQVSGAVDIFRLRGVDIHRVGRCDAVTAAVSGAMGDFADRDDLRRLDELIRRLAGCASYDEATTTALHALDDLFGITHSVLYSPDDRDRLFAVATNGYAAASVGAEVALGQGSVGIAAERRQVVTIPSLTRARIMRTAVAHRGGLDDAGAIPPPSLEGVQSAAAVPLVVHGALLGVLGLESLQPGSFGVHNERTLRIIGGHLASTLAMLERDRVEARTPPPRRSRPHGPALEVSYYQADDSVFFGSRYVVKGVPGRILWALLREHAASGRVAFTNRELRLDERLGLPPGNDNLEARLLVLRRRLAAIGSGVRLERVARGHLELTVEHPLVLTEVPTSGPMRAAHQARQDV